MNCQNIGQVAGLTRRVNDSGTLRAKFDKLVESNHNELHGDKKTLDRRVATRWNSDLACLEAHIYFKIPVKQLTTYQHQCQRVPVVL